MVMLIVGGQPSTEKSGGPVMLPVRARVAVRLVLALVFLASAIAPAAGSDAKSLPPRQDAYRDMKLSKKARDALKEDPRLSLLKLHVFVKDRVAVLEGEVISQDQLREAASRVEKVPGIAEVRTGLVRVVAAKQEVDLIIPITPDPPTRTEAQSPLRVTGAVARPTTLPRPAEPIPELVAIRLDGPIPLPLAAEPVLTLRASPPLPDDMVAVVERARQAQPRFRDLDVELRGDVVWLRGSTEQVDAAMDFAQALTEAGVRHVVIQCHSPAR
jgi:hypothetical protein